MRKTYFLIGAICLACLTAFINISARYVGLAPVEDKIQNSATASAHPQLTTTPPPEKHLQVQTTPTQTHSPVAPLPHHIDQSIDTPPMAISSSLISDNSTLIEGQELTEVAQKLFTSVDKVFAIGINVAQLSAVTPNTVINLDLPQIGLVDYIIQDISSQNGITNLSGHINGDSNSIRSIHISWKDNAMFGSISTPHNVLHLATINNKHFLFIANPELTD